MVHAEAVHKRYGLLEVLKGITLEVAPREVMCLLGPSGSGKSTFLRCINHLEKINSGRLYVDGSLVGYEERSGRLRELPDREVCRRRTEIGMVFQRFNLFPHMTALENVVEAPVLVKKEPKAVVTTARPGPARPGRVVEQGRRLSQSALRRSAAAGRDREGPGHAAEAHALRRAHKCSRPRTGRGGARRDTRPRRGRHDDDRGHPRDRLPREVGDTLVFMDEGVVVEFGRAERSHRQPDGRSAPTPFCPRCSETEGSTQPAGGSGVVAVRCRRAPETSCAARSSAGAL